MLIAGIAIFMGIITAEVFYPEGYKTRNSEISELGATRPPNSVITQPSSTIFNLTMIFSGIAILVAMILIRRTVKDLWVNIPFILLGIGILGVGFFPGNITPWHPVFAMMTFTAGGLSAIVSYKIVTSPIRYVYAVLGIVPLCFLFFSQLFIPTLGMGGTERWVAYPIVFWLISIGSFFLGQRTHYAHISAQKKPQQS